MLSLEVAPPRLLYEIMWEPMHGALIPRWALICAEIFWEVKGKKDGDLICVIEA